MISEKVEGKRQVEPKALVEALTWRYATKAFDPARKISPEDWAALEQSLILAPSSYGLQPWKFVVITDPALRERLKVHSWNQRQVTECSHFVVFAGALDVTEQDVQRWVERLAQVRGVPQEQLRTYKEMMVGDLVNGPRHAWIKEWTARQTYIALGTLMTAAALLGIDTCPMEGIDAAQYDAVLGLTASGYRALCACAAGYRAADDKYAALPKVRYTSADVIHRIGN